MEIALKTRDFFFSEGLERLQIVRLFVEIESKLKQRHPNISK